MAPKLDSRPRSHDKKRSFEQAVPDGFDRMPSSENDLTDKEQGK
jgi:hypothetical protein